MWEREIVMGEGVREGGGGNREGRLGKSLGSGDMEGVLDGRFV